ncbi:hypothetical protein BH23GEM3_BH23GEM3_16820 [soil metagenome]
MLRRRPAASPDYRRTLHEFSRSVALIADADELHEVVAATLQEIFGLRHVGVFLRDGDGAPFRAAAWRGPDGDAARGAEFPADGRLARWLRVNETPFIPAEDAGVLAFLEDDERRTLERLGAAACLPLVAMNRLIGFLTVGPASGAPPNGASGLGLDPARRELLAALTGQAALAFENAALLREQKTRLKRMYRAERLATAGELAAGAAHEIRNPLTAVRSAIQYLRADYPEGTDRAALIDDILSEVDRIDGIVRGLLSFARPQEAKFEAVDLAELLRQSVALIAPRAHARGVTTALDAPPTLRLHADPNLLKQLLLNVLLNALQAMPEGGTLHIAAEPRNRLVRLLVADTGCGIPPEHLERIFDPFFSTKKEWTGLGLSICHGIVERHGGEITARSEPDRGTTLVILLPQGGGS